MELYRKVPRALQTRWASFENPTAGKGAAFGSIEAGECVTLLDTASHVPQFYGFSRIARPICPWPLA